MKNKYFFTRLWLAIKHTTWSPWDWMNQFEQQLFCLSFSDAWRLAGIILEAWEITDKKGIKQ